MTRIPLPDRVDEAVAQMSEALSDQLFLGGPDARVEELRRSILGREYVAPPDNSLAGLAAWLP